MTNEAKREFQDIVDRMKALAAETPPPPPPPPLQPPGGGGSYPDMEARVTRLETHVEHMRSDVARLTALPETVGRIEERVKVLPDKDWVGTKMRNWVGGVGTILGLLMVALKYIG